MVETLKSLLLTTLLLPFTIFIKNVNRMGIYRLFSSMPAIASLIAGIDQNNLYIPIPFTFFIKIVNGSKRVVSNKLFNVSTMMEPQTIAHWTYALGNERFERGVTLFFFAGIPST